MKKSSLIALTLIISILGGNIFIFFPAIEFNKKKQISSLNSLQISIDTPVQSASNPENFVCMNHLRNSGFEYANIYGMPDYYNDYGSTGFQNSNFSYTDYVNNGEYAALLQSRGSITRYAYGYMSRYFGDSGPLMNDGITLDFYYRLNQVPDLDAGSQIYFYIAMTNSSYYYYFYYYFSLNFQVSNNTYPSYAYINYDFNSTFTSWYHFNRNISADLATLTGLTGFRAISLQFSITSPSTAQGITEVVLDDIFLNDTINTNYIGNSEFETPNTWWDTQTSSIGELSLTTECTEGSYAFNMSIANQIPDGSDSGNVWIGRYLSVQYSYFCREIGDLLFEFDWKYSDQMNADNNQLAYLRLTFYNRFFQNFHIFYILGANNDQMTYTNGSFYDVYVYGSNFGIRGDWAHESIDPYSIVEEMGWEDIYLREFYLYAHIGTSNNTFTELLVDDFQLRSYPCVDPSFEESWLPGYTFLGWYESQDTTYINITSNAHRGSQALNMTIKPGESYISVSQPEKYLQLSDDIYTDFWWRLDEIPANGDWRAYFMLTFEGGKNLYYILGADDLGLSNYSDTAYFYVEDMNTTGEWRNLRRDLIADLNNAFNLPDYKWNMTNFLIIILSSGSEVVSLLVDDLYFLDYSVPTVDLVEFLNTPTYYSGAEMRIKCWDAYSRIDNVSVYYRIQGSGILNHILASSTQGNYDALFPVYPYGTVVEYYIEVYDTVGNVGIDNNGGLYYTFTPGDDVDPTVEFLYPYNNSILLGDIPLMVGASDIGSDIDHVDFYADFQLLGTTTVFPFIFVWDSRTIENGMYSLTARAYDLAGNLAVTSAQVIVLIENDFQAPSLSQIQLIPNLPLYGEPVEMICATTDSSGISNVTLYYRINGESWISVNMTTSGQIYTSLIPSGDWNDLVEYYAVAYDIFGQTVSQGSASSPFSYHVSDTIFPELQINGPDSSTILKGNAVEFTINATDFGSGVARFDILVDGEIIMYNITENPALFLWDTFTVENSLHIFKVRVFDYANNTAEESIEYEVSNPQGFFPKLWYNINNVLQSYYSMAIGAGVMGIAVGSGFIIAARVKGKKKKK